MSSASELEVFKQAYRDHVGEVKDEPAWRVLTGAAIWAKHTGDLDRAIEAMLKALDLTRTVPALAEETATNLNYLAAELYLPANAIEQAENALRESICLARPSFPGLLADDLWILAGIQYQKGEHREALGSAEEALALYERQGHSHGVAQAKALIERIKEASSHARE